MLFLAATRPESQTRAGLRRQVRAPDSAEIMFRVSMDLIVLPAGTARAALLVHRVDPSCGCRDPRETARAHPQRFQRISAIRAHYPPRAPGDTVRGQRAPSGPQRLHGAHPGRR